MNLLRLIVMLPILLILSGCGKETANQSGPKSGLALEFWHYQSGVQEKAIDELLRKFESENPEVKVRGVFQGNPNQLKQKLDGAFASGAGNNPAVSLVYENWTDDFLARGYVEPVQGYIDGADGWLPDEQKDFVRAFVDGNTWDGKLVTLPFNKSIYLLYLNMDMMRNAGYTTAPLTQADFADAVRKLTLRKNGRTTTYGMGVIPKGEGLTTLLLAGGGVLTGDDGRPRLNSPEALQALTLLKSLQFPDKLLYVNTDYMSMPFSNQMIASFIYSSASLPYNESGSKGKFDYKAAPIPGVAGKTPRYLMQGANIAMFSNKTKEEKAAAWKLVKFLTSPDNAAFFIMRSGYMPYRYSMLEQPDIKRYMAEHPDFALASHLVLTDQGVQEPKVRQWEGVRGAIDQVVDQALSRPDSDPKALLDKLQAEAEKRMK